VGGYFPPIDAIFLNTHTHVLGAVARCVSLTLSCPRSPAILLGGSPAFSNTTSCALPSYSKKYSTRMSTGISARGRSVARLRMYLKVWSFDRLYSSDQLA
jgi:hypothetical protein